MADKNVLLHDTSGNNLYPRTKAANLTDTVPVSKGGTGADNASDAVTNLGIGDYVVEQGTSGIWTFRKWASGIAECWGIGTFTDACNQSWGSLYETKGHNFSYPSGLFVSSPNVFNVYLSATSGASGWAECSPYNESKNTTPLIYACRASSGSSMSWSARMHAFGRWK